MSDKIDKKEHPKVNFTVDQNEKKNIDTLMDSIGFDFDSEHGVDIIRKGPPLPFFFEYYSKSKETFEQGAADIRNIANKTNSQVICTRSRGNDGPVHGDIYRLEGFTFENPKILFKKVHMYCVYINSQKRLDKMTAYFCRKYN